MVCPERRPDIARNGHARLLRGGLLALAGWLWLTSIALAAEPLPKLFRIGSGGVGGIYLPIAEAIATTLSGFAPCAEAPPCGIPGLLAVAQVSNGSVANVHDLRDGSLEAGLVQADVAYVAYFGSGAFAGQGGYSNLRAIANLYPEAIHLVVQADGPLRTAADLAGRRVSLDEPGSGTLASARLVLAAFNLSESALQAVYLKQQLAAIAMQEGRLDAFFLVAGYPAAAVANLAALQRIRLISLHGPAIDALRDRQPYLFTATIPADSYAGVPQTATLAVGAQLLVDARLDEALVYRITRLLWGDSARQALQAAHPMGRQIQPERALAGIVVPLHAGAARYYRETGLLRQPSGESP
jgi:TRAP transporter TAXI family solute receptor